MKTRYMSTRYMFKARDSWKKLYFEEKKKTAPMEDQNSKLKQSIDAQHKQIMNNIGSNQQPQAPVSKYGKGQPTVFPPSEKV